MSLIVAYADKYNIYISADSKITWTDNQNNVTTIGFIDKIYEINKNIAICLTGRFPTELIASLKTLAISSKNITDAKEMYRQLKLINSDYMNLFSPDLDQHYTLMVVGFSKNKAKYLGIEMSYGKDPIYSELVDRYLFQGDQAFREYALESYRDLIKKGTDPKLIPSEAVERTIEKFPDDLKHPIQQVKLLKPSLH